MHVAAEATRLLSLIAREEANLDDLRRLAPRLTHGALNVELTTRKIAGYRAELAALSGQAPAAHRQAAAPASEAAIDASWDRAGRAVYGDRWKGISAGQATQAPATLRLPGAPPAPPATASDAAIDAGWDRAGRHVHGDRWKGIAA